MKNFFKKLSFVLAIAMVLTSLTPATASAASKNYVTLKGSSTKPVTSVYAWIGGVTRNLDYNIGGKTSGLKGTWKSSNEDYVKVNASTGVITPVANGSAYVTFTTADGKTTVKTVVKARTRAAALHIYDSAEYAAGNKVQLENKEGVTPSAIELKVGETKDLRITMPLSKKQQDAGAKIASYYTYAEVDDDAVVQATKDAEGNERAYTLTAKAVGETTVTIVANQSTLANVRKNKYYREATINVTVTDDTVGFGASQTGAKEIKVTGLEGAAKDNMEVTVKRGSIAVQTTSVKAEDANTLVLTTASRLQDATYTVTVDKKEASFTGAAEKLTTLAIIGEYAVVDNADIRQATKATVPYEAKNQFGEDINVSLTASSSLSQTVSANKGIITITINQTSGAAISLIEGQVISVSIVSATDGKSAAATVKLSASSKIRTLTVEGIYNKDDLSFNEDNKDKGDFYLILDAEDQYGYKVTDSKAAKGSLMGVCTNSLVAEMKQNTTDSSDLVYETLTIKGVKKLGVQILPKQAGTTNVILTPRYYGGSVQHEVTVLSGTKVDTLTFFQPESAYKNEDILIPVEAVDANGNTITDPKALNDWVGSENGKLNITTSNTTGKYEKPFEKTAAGVLVYNAGKVDTNILTINATTPTYKFASIVVYLKDSPIPSRIAGISSSKVLNLVSGGAVTLSAVDFKVYDTDDREMDLSTTNYKITFIPATSTENTGLSVTGTAIAGKNDKMTVTASGVGVNWTVDTNEAVRTVDITFQIVDNTGNKVGDPYTATFKNVNLTKLTKAEISAPELIYAASTSSSVTHTRKEGLQVYGYYGSDKVIIPGEFWTITNMEAVTGAFINIVTQSGIKGASIGAITGASVTTGASIWDSVPGNRGSRTKSVNLAIAVSGSSVAATKTVTACEAQPVLTTITANPFADKNNVTATGENQFTVKLPKTTGSNTITGGAIINKYLSVKDQYGVDYAANLGKSEFEGIIGIGKPVVLITDSSKDVQVKYNGTNNPEISALNAGDSFTATITWGTKTITVNVEQR